ncbi:DUF6397 family protein [Streptomyces sp. NPDC088400]|uniref:DUF6397 family protein n=1 Tax=Streptomyces sp. NPDC088400 TaxID=3365861 RepID=UPI00380312E3
MSVSDVRSGVRSGVRSQSPAVGPVAGAGGGAGAGTGAGGRAQAVGVTRAARELCLKRGEFELAAQLGHIRTISGATPGRRQVTRREIDRLRAAEGFPDTLRERVRTVGTAEGAALMPVSPGRFARLARAGFITPVRFYLNRYRAVVWLYLADELRAFAAREPELLTGRLPRTLCGGLDAGDDLRPRNWRGRRIGHLLHESDGPWERAAVVSCVLDPAQLAELARDPYERAYLNRLRPDLAHGYPESEAAQATVRRLVTADHPDEIRWHRASLHTLLAEARRTHPAPRSGTHPVPRPEGPAPDEGIAPGGDGAGPLPVEACEPACGGDRRGLLARLRIKKGRRPGTASRP